jgi:hypothetical protein
MKCKAVNLLAKMVLTAPIAISAHAGVHIDVGLGLIPPPVYLGPPPRYYSPPPPVYYGPGVVYGDPDWDYGGDGWRAGHWEHRHWHPEHWHGDRGWDGRHDRWHGGR